MTVLPAHREPTLISCPCFAVDGHSNRRQPFYVDYPDQSTSDVCSMIPDIPLEKNGIGMKRMSDLGRLTEGCSQSCFLHNTTTSKGT